MDRTDAARLLTVLVRADDEARRYFSARTRTAEEVPVEELDWWATFLCEVAAALERDDPGQLRQWRDALASRVSSPEVPSPAAEPEPEASPARREVPASPTSAPSPWARDAASPGEPPKAAADRPIPPAAPPPAPPPPAEASPPPTDSGAGVDQTGFLDPSALGDLTGALPFDAQAPAVAPPTAVDPDESSDLAGETGFLDASALGDLTSPTPSAPDEAAPEELPLPIERYAALVARSEWNPSPENRRALHEELQIADEQHRRAIDGTFQAALERDAALKAQYDDLYRQWQAWLQRLAKQRPD